MTKCGVCGNDDPRNVNYCTKCGNPLNPQGANKTPGNSSDIVDSISARINNASTHEKICGGCCLLLIILALIGSVMPDNNSTDLFKENASISDNNTHYNNSNVNTSQDNTGQDNTGHTSSSAEKNITVQPTSENSSVYWEFTGIENPDYESGYEFALITTDDGKFYYLTEDDATEMWDSERAIYLVDKKLNEIYQNEYTTSYVMSSNGLGIIKTKNNQNISADLNYGFTFKNTNNMTFTYKKGKDVGRNNDTREITHIWINDKQIF